MFICKNCNKYYKRKSYYDVHIKNNSCIKTNNNWVKPIKNEENEKNVIEQIIEDTALDVKKNENTNDLIEEKCKELENKIMYEIYLLKEEISKLKPKDVSSHQKTEIKYVPIKKMRLDFDNEITKKFLMQRNIESDVDLLYKIYLEGLEKENYPIKKIKKNDVSYWNGEEWINDNNMVNIKDILSSNLKKIYTKNNIMNNTMLDGTNYLSNQEHINQLSQKKYQNELIQFFLDKYL